MSAGDVALTIDLATQQIDLQSTSIDVTLDVPSVDVTLGLPGPTGPPGLVKVTHGSDANVARPAAPLVYWVGTVQPVNALADDLLLLK